MITADLILLTVTLAVTVTFAVIVFRYINHELHH